MRVERVVCPEPGRIELETAELAAPGRGEVLVQTEVTAVSPGTERAWFLHEPNTPVQFPYHPGYCQVGRVAALGPEARGLSEGDRVLTHAPHASAALVRADRVQAVPSGVDPAAAVMAPLGQIALQGVRRARIELGSATCVLGAGVIGGLALKFAHLSGAWPLVAAEPSAWRRARAASYGATHTVGPDELESLVPRLERRRSPDPGFDCVIDATGHPAALSTAIAVAASQATLVLLGSTRGLADGVNVYDVHRKGLSIVGAHGRNAPPDRSQRAMWTVADDIDLVLRLTRNGRFTPGDLVTDIVRPADVPGVFERLGSRDETLLGCIIDWR